MLLRRHSALLLFLVVLSLCGLGVVMLYSASAFSAEIFTAGEAERILKQQAIWLTLGLIGFGVMALVDYRIWGRYMWWLLGLTAVLLVLCYVPGIGKRVNGATRWIGIGGFTIQPSEITKLCILLFLGWWYDRYEKRKHTFLFGFLIPAGILGILLGLILFEKDVGTAALLSIIIGVIWFIAGIRLRYLILATILGMGAIGAIILKDPERMRRIVAHTREGDEAQNRGESYQQIQSLIALGSGGMEGLGIGESRQKRYYLPEAHTDFIFAIIGEELGLRATLIVVFGFVMIMVVGGGIATSAMDVNGILISIGTVTLLGFQAFINIGVVTHLLPNKGLPLPFISYGGSSLVICLTLVGLLVSVARHTHAIETAGQVGMRLQGVTS